MNACRKRIRRASLPALLVLLAFGLTACGEGPGSPRPPQSPPRPTMMPAGHFTTADLVLHKLPVPPPPGAM